MRVWRKAGTPGWKRLAMIGLVATAGIVVYRNPKYRDRLKGLASAAMGRFRGGSLDDVGPAITRALQQVDPRTAIALIRMTPPR